MCDLREGSLRRQEEEETAGVSGFEICYHKSDFKFFFLLATGFGSEILTLSILLFYFLVPMKGFLAWVNLIHQ